MTPSDAQFYGAMSWLIAHPSVVALIGLFYAAMHVFTCWHCLSKVKGVDRLTWLFAICTLPVFGAVFYFVMAEAEAEETMTLR